MVFGAADLARELDGLTDAEIERRFRNDLNERFPPLRGNVKETVIQRWPHAAPHPRPGRSVVQAALVKPVGRVHLAGDYLGITYIDTAIATAATAAHRIRRVLENTAVPALAMRRI
jgi:oxygen-dependent protoporphyrinogen oxidase